MKRLSLVVCFVFVCMLMIFSCSAFAEKMTNFRGYENEMGNPVYFPVMVVGTPAMVATGNSNTFKMTTSNYKLCIAVSDIQDTISFDSTTLYTAADLKLAIDKKKLNGLYAIIAVTKVKNTDTFNRFLVLTTDGSSLQIIPCSSGAETICGFSMDKSYYTAPSGKSESIKLLIDDMEDSTVWTSDATTSATVTIDDTVNHTHGKLALSLHKDYAYTDTIGFYSNCGTDTEADYDTATAADSYSASNTPVKSIDRDLTTYWQAVRQSDTGYLQVSLGNTIGINRVQIISYGDSYPTKFAIQCWSSNRWNTVTFVSSNALVNYTTTFNSAPASAYWRVAIYGTVGTSAARIAEFYLWETNTLTSQYAFAERSLDSLDLTEYSHGQLRVDGWFNYPDALNYAFIRMGSVSNYSEWQLAYGEVTQNKWGAWTMKLGEPTTYAGLGMNDADVDYMAIGFRMQDTYTQAILVVDQIELYKMTATVDGDERIGKKVIIKDSDGDTVYGQNTPFPVTVKSIQDRVITTGNLITHYFDGDETWVIPAAMTIKSIGGNAFSAAGSTSGGVLYINIEDDSHTLFAVTCTGLATSSVVSAYAVNDIELYLEAGDKLMFEETVGAECTVIGKYR